MAAEAGRQSNQGGCLKLIERLLVEARHGKAGRAGASPIAAL